MIEVHAHWFPGFLHANKGPFPASVLEFPYQLFANLIVVAEEAYARIAAPRGSEGHHIGEGTAGIQKTSRQDNERTIGAPILQAHDGRPISRVFGEHDHETQGGRVYKANEARRSMKHHGKATQGSKQLRHIRLDPDTQENQKNEHAFRWKPALGESLLFTGIMHSFNIATEAGTRDTLNGHWFQDYTASVSELRGWSDSDKFMAPYIRMSHGGMICKGGSRG
jgi:hypothetical protein